MQRASLFVIGTIAIAVLSLVNAQEPKDQLPLYSVRFELVGSEAWSVSDNPQSNKPQAIKDGVSTDVPVWTTAKGSGIGLNSFSGRTRVVPSPARMANPQTNEKLEFVPLGPRLVCRIRRIDDARLLLDVTLSQTVSDENDVASGILNVTTHQLRSFQPVRRGEPVTLSWPMANGDEKPPKVTITVLESK